MIGVASTKDYIEAVVNKLIPNIKVTVEYIKSAEMIFGKDLGAIMGKTTGAGQLPWYLMSFFFPLTF